MFKLLAPLYITLEMVAVSCPRTSLGSENDMVYGHNFMLHLVLEVCAMVTSSLCRDHMGSFLKDY